MRLKYYCFKCNHFHFYESKIGKEHSECKTLESVKKSAQSKQNQQKGKIFSRNWGRYGDEPPDFNIASILKSAAVSGSDTLYHYMGEEEEAIIVGAHNKSEAVDILLNNTETFIGSAYSESDPDGKQYFKERALEDTDLYTNED